ncbi:hypothetical protein DY000_02031518 [Brassica cretica]|uniref:HSF-type DNA-binding domain-containing protein n=1 Tax=Brassica cretica TaxID=69181 RepID=A0ABQ7DYY0_BRACR|nr:hypothetical protein DY000_02031518 [Brassica cretica]
MEVFHIRKYGRFSLSVICLFLELEAVPRTDTGVLDTGDPERFWNGDPEIRVLPWAQRKMIPEYFSPTGQVTGLHRTREETNPELSSEFQILVEKINDHSKQLEQSAKNLSQLESENLTLRDENQALNMASNKKRRFRTQVRPMSTLETPNSGTGANLPTTTQGGDASMREKAKDAQTCDVEDSDSEAEPDEEAPDGAVRAESPMIAHLHQMFSERLDAMQSMVHSFLYGSQRQILGAIRQPQGPGEDLRQPLRNPPAPSGTPVKWEEDVASRAKAQQKQDPKTIRPDRTEQNEKPSQRPARDSENRNRGRYQNRPIEKSEGMAVSTWPEISHLSVSRPELINVLRQMGQQVKWPQKMKAPDSFQNPGFWCDFHRDHGHKTEDGVALKIEVNELLKKGHLREFLSEKAKSHLNKETTGKPTESTPVSPPRQD